MRVGSLPRIPKRSVDKWAFSILCNHRGPLRHYYSSWNSDRSHGNLEERVEKEWKEGTNSELGKPD